MLLVRRSDENWQLTKSSLQEVDIWHMWESISCSEEDDCATVQCCTVCTDSLVALNEFEARISGPILETTW